MRLFIQIPCLNEEETLPMVLKGIPTHIDGIDEIHILVVDDGSTDATVEVARQLGVEHFVFHTRNMGLARSFRDGVDYALQHGADIVVNTDGDNQYPQERIADLVAPMLRGEADIVIGDRQTKTIEHFSAFKKLMQSVGSRVVNFAAETDLPDAASGFRAYSRESLIRLNVVTQFSYCMETIIQAGNKRLRIFSVPIRTNPKTRESRLFKNIFQHMARSAQAIMRSYVMFKPHALFVSLAVAFFIAAAIPFGRFLVLSWLGVAGSHIQSLVFGSAMLVGGLLSLALIVISDMIRTNRTLLEDSLERVKLLQYSPDRVINPNTSVHEEVAQHPSLPVSMHAAESVIARAERTSDIAGAASTEHAAPQR
ncbi:glycosyltransferase involved in cell wall biosynthesis [Microbacterium endophyticum]|uniref:Glycosyltransferase involved in cell wall biosynthesis n=1 Tax=Microbacterium endophyticum TaxID=1526412 RepID=A0A7W4V519_9MICO|nr:glycosyltransferase family 2 protein [Microbacterium endophyticum]MBB2976338.1 glycosyltransferase involved in cell wall biosynthesis [Microbacterium endophyticum]NIK35218.1 glycosyltransferase involved in cell wall biosynthesis [Microbacterium endophyticum]